MQGQVYEKKMKFAFKYTLFEGTETKQNKTIASRQLTGKLDLGEQSKKKKKESLAQESLPRPQISLCPSLPMLHSRGLMSVDCLPSLTCQLASS